MTSTASSSTSSSTSGGTSTSIATETTAAAEETAVGTTEVGDASASTTGPSSESTSASEADTGGGESSDDALCPASAWFCEDFESLPLGSFAGDERWAVVVNNSDRENRDLAIGDAMPHTGTAALRATTASGDTNNWQNYLLHTFDVPRAAFFGRAFYYVATFADQTDGSAHWMLLEHRAYGTYNGIENENPGHVIRILNGFSVTGDEPNQTVPLSFNYAGVPEMGTRSSAQPVFDGRWVCFEWAYDEPANRLALWMDGELVLESEGIGDYVLPPAETVAIGAASNSGNYAQGFDVWIDDLALGSERLGCGAP